MESILFQYRKRYGLHAICTLGSVATIFLRFNTASGMDCMQSGRFLIVRDRLKSFNTASGMDCMQCSNLSLRTS